MGSIIIETAKSRVFQPIELEITLTSIEELAWMVAMLNLSSNNLADISGWSYSEVTFCDKPTMFSNPWDDLNDIYHQIYKR